MALVFCSRTYVDFGNDRGQGQRQEVKREMMVTLNLDKRGWLKKHPLFAYLLNSTKLSLTYNCLYRVLIKNERTVGTRRPQISNSEGVALPNGKRMGIQPCRPRLL
jgi:hypothetical protein